MARRRGRPRKLERRKKSARAAKKLENSLPPVEGLIRRLEAIGVDVPPPPRGDSLDAMAEYRKVLKELARENGVLDTSIDHPLDLLHARGELLDPRPADWARMNGEEREAFDATNREIARNRHVAGARYAWLWWRRYGKPFGKAMDLHMAETEPPPPPKRPDGWELLSVEEQEIWYALALQWMDDTLGRHEQGREMRAVVVSVCCHCRPPTSAHAVTLLRRGLSVLMLAPMPDPRRHVLSPSLTEEEARRRYEAAKREARK